jgi:hypothetical protein
MSQYPNAHEGFSSYRLRRAAPNDPVVGAYGGHPRGVKHGDWPKCTVCKAPMCHVVQLDAGAWLDLGFYKRLTVFICHATGGRCRDWEPFSGANRVLLHGLIDDDLYDGPATVRVYPRRPLAIGPAFDEQALLAHSTEDPESYERFKPIRYDKVGGAPAWLYEEDVPKLSGQPEETRMVLQMTRAIVPFDITDGGVAYVFFNPSGEVSQAAALLWQSGRN